MSFMEIAFEIFMNANWEKGIRKTLKSIDDEKIDGK